MKKTKNHPEDSRRLSADRKIVNQISALNVKNITSGEVLFSRASVIDVSPTGLLLRVKRDEILTHKLRSTLTLSIIHGESVGFSIEVMDTYIEGVITRTKAEGRGDFLAAVDFRDDAPDYWRQCFVDLLPDESE
jgi:hypothetical protein